jgi:hypothetical protein
LCRREEPAGSLSRETLGLEKLCPETQRLRRGTGKPEEEGASNLRRLGRVEQAWTFAKVLTAKRFKTTDQNSTGALYLLNA